MYSSYGSYSSLSSVAQPLDIAPSSYLSHSSASYGNCAFPSWPQRSSLTDSAHEQRASSYLSDDDLFPCEVVEDDAHSIASADSTASTSLGAHEEEMLARQQQKMAMQQEAMKFLLGEKERRRQQAKRQRRSGGSCAKKSPKNNGGDHMSAITE
ncbi:Uu.00g072950.m01.CDS01 [Anthostomella pinea]|uniref:Uu.00g072950.m01.CDS01 n=1 Tax=Anthostomella pinea TaxID=933095 RepID=A0AAI8VW27_9PEZI|nr:Uu.00g072950.m01.CDS01 [Anthostomella pinea]